MMIVLVVENDLPPSCFVKTKNVGYQWEGRPAARIQMEY